MTYKIKDFNRTLTESLNGIEWKPTGTFNLNNNIKTTSVKIDTDNDTDNDIDIKELGDYEIKTGTFNTNLGKNNAKTIFDTVIYSGEYIEYYNENGMKVRSPLAIAKYKKGKIVFEPMTEKQKNEYINKVTQYYKDIAKDLTKCSAKFKKEINNRVDTLTMIYIDPDSKEDIDDANGCAAYCLATNRFSTHSDIVVFSSEFINLNDKDDWHNKKDAYDYMIGVYIHECGHAYANVMFTDRDETSTWKKIYKQVVSETANHSILDDYSFTNRAELFADSIELYFHDPNKLKMIDIDIDGYETLYDYMNEILN